MVIFHAHIYSYILRCVLMSWTVVFLLHFNFSPFIHYSSPPSFCCLPGGSKLLSSLLHSCFFTKQILLHLLDNCLRLIYSDFSALLCRHQHFFGSHVERQQQLTLFSQLFLCTNKWRHTCTRNTRAADHPLISDLLKLSRYAPKHLQSPWCSSTCCKLQWNGLITSF